MQQERCIIQCNENFICFDENGEVPFIDYMPGFETEKLIEPCDIDELNFDYSVPCNDVKGKLSRPDFVTLSKYMNNEDIANLAKTCKKGSNLGYLMHQNSSNTKCQGNIFSMQTHVIYTGMPNAPCQFIKDNSHTVKGFRSNDPYDKRLQGAYKLKRVIKGNPVSNEDYLNCNIYTLVYRKNPIYKILIGFDKEIPKDLFNCIMYFIKVKSLTSTAHYDEFFFVDRPVNAPTTLGNGRRFHCESMGQPIYEALENHVSKIYLSEYKFYELLKTNDFEIQKFKSNDVIGMMIELPLSDPFRIKYVEEFDNQVSVNGIFIKKQKLGEFNLNLIEPLSDLNLVEVTTDNYNSVFGFKECYNYNNELLKLQNEFKYGELNQIHVIDFYISIKGDLFRKGYDKRIKILLMDRTLYTNILILNMDSFIPIHYYSRDTLDDIVNESYSATAQLKNTDIFFMCKNYGHLNDLLCKEIFPTPGFESRILCIKKYNVIDPTLVITSNYIDRPVDLFYYKYRASKFIPCLKCNHSMEDYIISITGAVPLPIEDFTKTDLNSLLEYPPDKIIIFNNVYIMDYETKKYKPAPHLQNGGIFGAHVNNGGGLFGNNNNNRQQLVVPRQNQGFGTGNNGSNEQRLLMESHENLTGLFGNNNGNNHNGQLILPNQNQGTGLFGTGNNGNNGGGLFGNTNNNGNHLIAPPQNQGFGLFGNVNNQRPTFQFGGNGFLGFSNNNNIQRQNETEIEPKEEHKDMDTSDDDDDFNPFGRH